MDHSFAEFRFAHGEFRDDARYCIERICEHTAGEKCHAYHEDLLINCHRNYVTVADCYPEGIIGNS